MAGCMVLLLVLCCVLPAPAQNVPPCAHLVSPGAWPQGALGACGAPLVGVVAERMFGFSGAVGAQGGAADAVNAAALANSLLVMFVVPWTACLLAFTGARAAGAVAWGAC